MLVLKKQEKSSQGIDATKLIETNIIDDDVPQTFSSEPNSVRAAAA